jgi:hypothetical protein
MAAFFVYFLNERLRVRQAALRWKSYVSERFVVREHPPSI